MYRMAPKVLLVDDDRLIHQLYQPHIERAGYELVSAFKGNDAVELAARELPQAIIMDIMMPELDGLSAVREMKLDDRTKNIPVIVITANPSLSPFPDGIPMGWGRGVPDEAFRASQPHLRTSKRHLQHRTRSCWYR